MAAVTRVGWFLEREIKGDGDDGFLRGGGAMSRASAPAPVAPPAALQQQPRPSSAMAAKITPALLFITVVLAVVLLVSGMLHVLRRLFLKSHHDNARAETVERQLQQLFHLQEDGAGPGLDQADIDALPAFSYGELSGAAGVGDRKKRQFDCAVCLCGFAGEDRLRLLPLCGHAFHVACIDTWLSSSSTCPLCRTALSVRALAAAAAAAGTSVEPDIEEQKQEQEASKEVAVMLPVRLGRFKNVQGGAVDGETSTSRRLDARRCYSMGSSCQYVLADDNLVVSVHWRPRDGSAAMRAGVAEGASEQQGKKVCAAGRGDSFSVSKIWQWRGSGRRASESSPAARGKERAPDNDTYVHTSSF